MPLFQGLSRSPSSRSPAPGSAENETGSAGVARRITRSKEDTKSPGNASPIRTSFLSLLRSGSGSGVQLGSSQTANTEKESEEQKKVSRAVAVQIPESRSDNHRHQGHDAPLSPESPTPSSFMGEPKQPTNIQDAIESHLNASENPKGDRSKNRNNHPHKCGESHLSTGDLKHVFSGAPHFMLEKGRNELWYPQVIFPWDQHDPIIQDLWDRQPLSHASFTLSTLHAHLPVPDEWTEKGDTRILITDWRRKDDAKRATFDVGVFEVPNMLSMNGKEPGCVGFRYFLELPLADNVRYNGPPVPKGTDFQKLASLPVSEAFRIMEHFNDPYSECNRETVHDRHKLITEGPSTWKRIGVRDFTMKAVVDRLDDLRRIRDEILLEGQTTTVLDKESTRTLYDNLFTKLLYPPTRVIYTDPYSLKVQIEVLTRVLATKGAWFDFNLVEWRIRIGQILWEVPPHPDGDCLDPKACPDDSCKAFIERGIERKWLLLQILLAAELLIRLDAVVRVGILQESQDIVISTQEVEQFDKLRTGKVNWDLILARRFLSNLAIKHYQHTALSPTEDHSSSPSQDKPSGRHRFLPRIGSLKHRDTKMIASADPESAWDYILIPRRAEQQLHGLFVFAESINWPGIEEFKETMKSKLKFGQRSSELASIYGLPVRNVLPENYAQTLEKNEMYRKSPSRRLVLLHWPCVNRDGMDTPDAGGWMSRTWLSGLVLPGEAISHFLMATVLENNPKAMEKLGPLANLYGGFVYDGASWWSKSCVVGRVLSCLDGTTGCMGWMRSTVVPRDARGGESLGDAWFEVEVKDAPQKSNKPRIRQGTKLAIQSTPLGIGKLSGETFSLPVDESHTTETTTIAFQSLLLAMNSEQMPEKHVTLAKEASVTFSLTDTTASTSTTVSFCLAYNVQFISSYTCRPPHGYATHCCSTFPKRIAAQQHKLCSSSEHVAEIRLPGHPLHMSYPYRHIPLVSLTDTLASAMPSSRTSGPASSLPETWVLDARGSRDREAFARAWCASVGTSAVIGRVGRTCLACCIREARAVDVGVVIRVGD